MADPRIKALKIKTGVVKRLSKEKVMYEKEADTQRTRIERLKSEGKDEYVIRKQEEVLRESLSMVPDCQRRLAKAFEELQTLVDHEKDLQDQEDYSTAVRILEEAKPELPDF